ncbi:hypothetical protein M441DRAFT_68793 [Trichoderma asperellum CBS 433.97]|uniref:FHA domain-containing protein n=1 Tax=Trichoderma asperellum (strain ATCC 204424 / CBS 433.97 / NBRC 101777) TaxID=1042311 RepID=A0A2T3ZAD3_TRIA4|nr:hypothetical protein M441DRAFT_68793 [Trichoderma asperellum CBS 433.97]PTB41778.1 hypothetical protein M441DRAFT_68793 [Trichoderma asperellum CBS 433.97]
MDSPTRKPAAAQVALPAPSSTTTTTTSSASSTSSTSASASSTSLASPLKRPAPSLLPPFEPSSSPGLPRPAKRQNVGSAPHLRYPTPNIPTSSTGILSSSPLREKLSRGASERTPLSAVPSIELNENGEMLLMGRSSNSSHFQLSANRLISRVHVKARYVQAATPLEANKIEITCNGWNGLKLHCQGRTWELLKGDSFTSETEGTEIMVDVHDARVLIQWPKRSSSVVDANGLLSDASWEDSPPRSQTRASAMLQASPLRRPARIQSPDSPTPAPRRRSVVAADEETGIQIYEDDDENLPDSDGQEDPDVSISMRTEATASFSSDFEPDEEEDDESDPDEENDPIIHSFGPYGANISTRMASISTKSPRVTSSKRALKKGSTETLVPRKTTRDLDSAETSPRKRAKKEASREQTPTPNGRREKEEEEEEKEVKREQEEEEEEEGEEEEEKPPKILSEADAAISNHVVNQLAYSRLSSTPLSTIMHNLPAEQTKDLSRDALRVLIETTACIGIIERQGKDAAGKALESEYYYIPEADTDAQRRAAVVDGLRKPSLRACRKQHKQYYWKRPKTP